MLKLWWKGDPPSPPTEALNATPLGGSSLLRTGLCWLPLKICRHLPLFALRGLAGMISAITKFHNRRLEQQQSMLQSEKTKARYIGSLNEKGLSNKFRNKSPAADIINLSTLAANLEQRLNNFKYRMSNLKVTVF